MTRPIEATRFAGFFLALAGAWWHTPWLVPTGFAVTILAWTAGLLPPRRDRHRTTR